MALDPGHWQSSSLKGCCKRFFGGYLYDNCMGKYRPKDDCVTALWYPDWAGSNKGCKNDGKEPYYMIVHKEYYLSRTREECCKQYYDWDYYECTGTLPELTNGNFYPDWSDYSDPTCRNNDKMPAYMLRNQEWYFSDSLKKCCERHFEYNMNKCMGTSAVGTQKWYVNYTAGTCVQDCVGASPCGGIAESWDELFGNKRDCCKAKLWWNTKCLRT